MVRSAAAMRALRCWAFLERGWGAEAEVANGLRSGEIRGLERGRACREERK